MHYINFIVHIESFVCGHMVGLWKYKMCDPHADRHSICAECSVRSFENLCTCVDQPKRYPMCELLHVGR